MGMQVALVYVDDWQGLYINEALVIQDHQISVQQVMDYVLYNHVDLFERIEASDANMAMTGAFPYALREVVLPDGRTMQERWDSE